MQKEELNAFQDPIREVDFLKNLVMTLEKHTPKTAWNNAVSGALYKTDKRFGQ